ncbi:hypothetical protein TNIN_391071 [Trichonephila inaurata madagascariensis]|uniref:Uncharacterized protein n=1 Tax=Trichonephila inaurata madagascariensis TaxID=2747483 RepID=A0A8X6Y8S2_9ARAC|nr:hypothetical protein TNIN_391071 [Trichonephila inaurata madagascariensis]
MIIIKILNIQPFGVLKFLFSFNYKTMAVSGVSKSQKTSHRIPATPLESWVSSVWRENCWVQGGAVPVGRRSGTCWVESVLDPVVPVGGASCSERV